MLLLKEKLHPGKPRKVGVIGLGTGTLATYGNKGMSFVFMTSTPQL